MRARAGELKGLWPFVAGTVAGAAGVVLTQALMPRRTLDTRLIRRPQDGDIAPVVVVPGIMGSELRRPDGSEAWLNLGNAFGAHALGLPLRLPLAASSDDLVPSGLLGVDAVLPRLFGFGEYADLVELLEAAGFRRDGTPAPRGLVHHVFTYDWRRDLVESARRLGATLDALAAEWGERHRRFNLVCHSMGGLVGRYCLRYGDAEPGGPVTWAGARRIRSLMLVGVPSGGGIQALDAILHGSRVGLSRTTLAASVVARMPSLYQILPPAGVPALLDHRAAPLARDLHDIATWDAFGWDPFAHAGEDRDATDGAGDKERQREFLAAALARARAFHAALAQPPEAPCPARVVVLGGDCLATVARAIVPEQPGDAPRFEPWTPAEEEAMYEAGDGRVTRASALAAHLPHAERSDLGCGLPEVRGAFFGSADHHGFYRERTFQSILLRQLLQPTVPAPARRR